MQNSNKVPGRSFSVFKLWIFVISILIIILLVSFYKFIWANPNSFFGYQIKIGDGVYWADYSKSYKVLDANLDTFKILANDWAKDKNHVFYGADKVLNADSATFKVIDHYFSKDKNYVFFEDIDLSVSPAVYKVKIIEGADPKSFRILSEFGGGSFGRVFSKDKDRVFYAFEVLPGADPNSFGRISDPWMKDKDNIFVRSSKFPNVDMESFQIINYSFAKDKNNVFTSFEKAKQIVLDADPNNFQVVDYNFSKDKNSVFYLGNRLPNVDSASFQPIKAGYSNSFAKDKNYVFFTQLSSFKVIPGADPNSFQVIGGSLNFSKDKDHVFSGAEIFINADPKTFKVLNDAMGCYVLAKDINNIFIDTSTLLGADPDTFEVTDNGAAKDKNNTYKIPGCYGMAV